MKIWPRSAARRIGLVAFLCYTTAMALVGVAIFASMHSAVERQIDQSIDQAHDSLMVVYRNRGLQGLSREIAVQERPGPIHYGFALVSPTGKRIAGNVDIAVAKPGRQTLPFRDPIEGHDRARVQVSQLPNGYRFVVAIDLDALDDADQRLLWLFSAALIVLLSIGAAGSWFLARYLSLRLATLESTALAIVSGDLTHRASVGGTGDEFDRVAVSLNAMLDRIGSLLTNLRQVSADLAHDLRTPLAALRNQLNVMRHDGGSADRIDLAVERADDILILFNAILRISEVEEGGLRKGFQPVDLSSLLGDLGETLALRAEDLGRRFEVSIASGLVVDGDRELLAQALINLAENAFRHTPEGTDIRLSARQFGETVGIEIKDNGPGIAEVDRERVLQRFVRLDAARNTPGHGLGLSLVCAIVDAHGGYLVLEDAGPGLAARFHVPVKECI